MPTLPATRSIRRIEIFPYSAVIGTLLALALASAPLAAQNLVPNGGFGAALADWELRPEGTAAAASLDIDDDIDSGSALLGNTEAAANARVYPLRQCLVLAHAGLHRLGASGFVPTDQSATHMVFSFFARAGTDCSGGVYHGGGQFLDTPGAWASTEFAINAPEAPSSVEILLGIEKTVAGGDAFGFIDDVYLLRDEHIFADGLESASARARPHFSYQRVQSVDL